MTSFSSVSFSAKAVTSRSSAFKVHSHISRTANDPVPLSRVESCAAVTSMVESHNEVIRGFAATALVKRFMTVVLRCSLPFNDTFVTVGLVWRNCKSEPHGSPSVLRREMSSSSK
jgi:hypothetical protein